MAQKKFQVDLNLNLNQLLQARLENVDALPNDGLYSGRRVFSTADKKAYTYNGTSWVADADQDAAKVTLVKDSTGFIYTLSQGGTEIGKINIPKDMVVQSGSVVTGTWNGNTFTESASGKGKAIKLVIANSSDIVYINVADLVDAYTAEETDTINLSITNNNIITAIVKEGSIKLVHLTTELQSLINGKVDKVEGKGLSTNDYTNADKTKLANLHETKFFTSEKLEGANGTVTLDGFDSNKSIIMQCTKNGEEIIISLVWVPANKQIEWGANTKFTADDNVVITAIQY